VRNAETILGIIHERGKRGLPLKDVYRLLYNPALYLRAYAKLYANEGAMTQGATAETVDKMSLAKIDTLIDNIRHERHRWTPARRTYIPKKNGRKRPLGLPTWTDKLLQEVLRMILESYYEPQFNQHSFGFRPGRGCHTALNEIDKTWTGVKWFLEGDIAGYFDNIDHDVLMSILSERIQDNRFLRLIRYLLKAGYLEDWRYHRTLSGSPQGGVVSPVLANIYLDRLDTHVEHVLKPRYNRGERRKPNTRYHMLLNKAAYKKKQGKWQEAKMLRHQAQHMPSKDPDDPDFRRLYYVRYADDTLFGFAGPYAEAEEIKQQLGTFLRDTLKVELSEEKTLITHARTHAARFLGYDIVVQHSDNQHGHNGHRNVNGRIGLRVPADVIKKKCAQYMRAGTPSHRPELLQDSDFTIIDRYQYEYRGVVQYYLMALNVGWLYQLHWVMRTSLLKTLANKQKATIPKMMRKYRATLQTPHGPMTCLEKVVQREGKKPLVTRFGGIPLKRQENAILNDLDLTRPRLDRNELLKRLLADTCELCGATKNIEVHHVRKLADLKTPGRKEKPLWMQQMIARRRKTLVVCQSCHDAIHAKQSIGKPKKKE
jgi:group II intron reverse transcriptase/maturase